MAFSFLNFIDLNFLFVFFKFIHLLIGERDRESTNGEGQRDRGRERRSQADPALSVQNQMGGLNP